MLKVDISTMVNVKKFSGSYVISHVKIPSKLKN